MDDVEHGLTGRSFLEAATAQQSFPRLIVRDHNRFRLVAPALDRGRSFTSWKGNSSQSQYLPKSIKNHDSVWEARGSKLSSLVNIDWVEAEVEVCFLEGGRRVIKLSKRWQNGSGSFKRWRSWPPWHTGALPWLPWGGNYKKYHFAPKMWFAQVLQNLLTKSHNFKISASDVNFGISLHCLTLDILYWLCLWIWSLQYIRRDREWQCC